LRSVLVSGASGIVGYGILRSLRQSGLPLKLVGTSIHADSVAPAFCDTFELAPHTDSPGYMEWLLTIVGKHHVNLIIPGIEIDMYKWSKHVSVIEQSGATVLLNNNQLIELCRDKWAFYEDLRSAAMPFAIESSLDANFEKLQERYGLPFLLKPRAGFASKGIVRVRGEADFLAHKQRIGQFLMAQPVVGNDDEEFTTSAFCDGTGGFHAAMTLKRKLSANGFTEKAEVASTEPFVATIAALCARFRPVGPTNFQFRTCSEGVKLLEINPRISSSTSIRSAFGYNESAMAVEYYLDNKTPTQPKIKRGKAVRFTDEHIFYEDGLHL